MKRWRIGLSVEFSGASATVDAETEAEAYAKAEKGEFSDGVDVNGAELVNWHRIKIGAETLR